MTDSAQQAAITHVSGPCLVVAGPGAGKTHVLVRRIAFLTKTAGIPPSQLLVITFTRAAAKEMQKRYLSKVPPEYSGVTFGTFHSIFFQILKRSGKILPSALIDAKTREHILQSAFKAAGIRDNRTEELMDMVSSHIGYIKNTDIDIEEFEPTELSAEEFKIVYEKYEKGKSRLGVIDFDDMLVMTRNLFLDNPTLLETYRRRFGYFLVDEAQDMNRIQYEVLQMMAKGKDNLFLVGDEDQSIYSFRGARPRLFLGFSKDYPETKTIVLSRNYRCDSQIVESAKRLISHNRERFDKELCAASEIHGSISYIPFHDAFDEARHLAAMIAEEKKRFPEKTIAILYRNHIQSGYIAKELKQKGLNPNGKKSPASWSDNPLVITVLDYIRASVYGPKREIVIRIINRPNRFLPREGLIDSVTDFEKWKRYYYDDEYVKSAIDKLKNDIESVKKLTSFAAVSYILYRIGTKKDAAQKGEYDEAALEELIKAAKLFPDKASLLEEEKSIKRKASEVRTDTSNEKDVYLYTYHGSKGLEFDHVYLIDVNEGITPSKRAETEESLEEERRMFYVALTRAKHELTISSLAKTGREEAYPSRFLKELKETQSGTSSSNSSKVSDTSSASSSDSILSSTGVPSAVSK